MDCTTCINRYNGKRSCRTMRDKPRKLFCHMTREQAIRAEQAIIKYSHGSGKEALKHIQWLEEKPEPTK